jgi:hypothetical protein
VHSTKTAHARNYLSERDPHPAMLGHLDPDESPVGSLFLREPARRMAPGRTDGCGGHPSGPGLLLSREAQPVPQACCNAKSATTLRPALSCTVFDCSGMPSLETDTRTGLFSVESQ